MENAENIAKEFIDKVFEENESRKHMCFTTCLPLSILLTRNRIKNSLRSGGYKANEQSLSIDHCWIFLEDENKFIDPTINQFYPNETKIIFEKSNFENEFKIKETTTPFNDWFFNGCNDLVSQSSDNDIEGYTIPDEILSNIKKSEREKAEIKKNIHKKILQISLILENKLAKLNFDESQLSEQERWIKGCYNAVVNKLKEVPR